jgi:hypothetical protein
MTVTALRSTASRILALRAEADDLDHEITQLVTSAQPQLLALSGVGAISAAQVLISWSHTGRFRSEAAFAAFSGAAPIPASSGLTTRHRLSRSGDRQLNRALHAIALTRARVDPDTRAYLARRTADGKTTREAMPQTDHRPPDLPAPPGQARPRPTTRTGGQDIAASQRNPASCRRGAEMCQVPTRTVLSYLALRAHLVKITSELFRDYAGLHGADRPPRGRCRGSI